MFEAWLKLKSSILSLWNLIGIPWHFTGGLLSQYVPINEMHKNEPNIHEIYTIFAKYMRLIRNIHGKCDLCAIFAVYSDKHIGIKVSRILLFLIHLTFNWRQFILGAYPNRIEINCSCCVSLHRNGSNRNRKQSKCALYSKARRNIYTFEQLNIWTFSTLYNRFSQCRIFAMHIADNCSNQIRTNCSHESCQPAHWSVKFFLTF